MTVAEELKSLRVAELKGWRAEEAEKAKKQKSKEAKKQKSKKPKKQETKNQKAKEQESKKAKKQKSKNKKAKKQKTKKKQKSRKAKGKEKKKKAGVRLMNGRNNLLRNQNVAWLVISSILKKGWKSQWVASLHCISCICSLEQSGCEVLFVSPYLFMLCVIVCSCVFTLRSGALILPSGQERCFYPPVRS